MQPEGIFSYLLNSALWGEGTASAWCWGVVGAGKGLSQDTQCESCMILWPWVPGKLLDLVVTSLGKS